MEPKYTRDEMREMANTLSSSDRLHPFALDRAASMLVWAADVIEAARAALAPNPQGKEP